MVHCDWLLGEMEITDSLSTILARTPQMRGPLIGRRMDSRGTTTTPAVAVRSALEQSQSDQFSQTLPGCLQAELLQYSDLLGREKLIGSQMAQKVKLLPGQLLAHGFCPTVGVQG